MTDISIVGADRGNVYVGEQCSIGTGVEIIFLGEGVVSLSDYVTLGDGVRIIVEGGSVRIGDWSTLHLGTTVFCKNSVTIGSHCWFGQYSVIDGTGGLMIEDGVRVGMYSQIWTHVAAGEQIEGCTLFGETPTHIESDVWLVGSCTVGSGVQMGRRAIALAGSNVTKSCPPNIVLAGSPAKIKEGLNFYRAISLDEKFELLKGWLSSAPFASIEGANLKTAECTIDINISNMGSVKFLKTNLQFETEKNPDQSTTFCCVENKKYTKKLSSAEYVVLKYLANNKARFYS